MKAFKDGILLNLYSTALCSVEANEYQKTSFDNYQLMHSKKLIWLEVY